MPGNERNFPSKEVHTNKPNSRTVSNESKAPSSDDTIMSDENWSYETQTEDSLMFDESYSTNTQSSTTTSYHPSSALESSAWSFGKRYVPAPRRSRGILDPREAAEDAAFFARANRRYRQGIQNVFFENERKARENLFGNAERKEVVSKTKARAASSTFADGKTVRFADNF